MNGIIERRNQTLQDMVRSMMAESSLYISLWGEALKIAIYLLNRVPTKATIKTPYELWTGRKPSLKYLYIWECPAQARPYVPKERKLDSRTTSCYFVGYSEKSWGFKFYDPSTRGIFEIGNAHFFEDIEFDAGNKVRDNDFQEEHDDSVNTEGNLILSCVQADLSRPSASYSQIAYLQEGAPLKESTVQEETHTSNNFSIYLQEHEIDLGMKEYDPINLRQALQSFNAHKWIDAMNEEIKSMHDNDVWDLVQLPEGLKPIGCKWIFKIKRDSKGNTQRYKARLVAKGFTQCEGIDYNETFSPVSSKDSFRIIMALVAHFNLELHQMDVKTAFLNGEIDETIYME